MSSDDIKQMIQRFRDENPMTQKQMADLAGISVRSLGDFERGLRKPSKLLRAKLLKSFPELLPISKRN